MNSDSGRPERPDDLRQHACVRLRRSNGALALWSLNDNGRAIEIAASGPLIANDFPTMLGAAVEGVGLAQVPEPIAAEAVTVQVMKILLCFSTIGIPDCLQWMERIEPVARAGTASSRTGLQRVPTSRAAPAS